MEYEAVTLAAYQVDLNKKNHHVDQVHGGRIIETPFRSPQLAFFDLEDGWVLYLPASERARPLRRRRGADTIEHLPLPDFLLADEAVPRLCEPPPRTPLQIVDG